MKTFSACRALATVVIVGVFFWLTILAPILANVQEMKL